MNLLFTYNVALALALIWAFFLNIAVNLWVGLFLSSNTEKEFNVLESCCSVIVVILTTKVLYTFEQQLFFLCYGCWDDFPQWRNIVRHTNVKHSRIIVQILYAGIIGLFIYTVCGPILCWLNEIIPRDYNGLKSVGGIMCTYGVQWDFEIRLIIQMCCIISLFQLSFSVAYIYEQISWLKMKRSNSEVIEHDKFHITMTGSRESVSLSARDKERLNTIIKDMVTKGEKGKFGKRGSTGSESSKSSGLFQEVAREKSTQEIEAEKMDIVFVRKLKTLGVGLCATIFLFQAVILGFISSFNYGNIHAILMPCGYALVGYVAYISKVTIDCHHVLQAEVPFSPYIIWFMIVGACTFITSIICKLSQFQGNGPSLIVWVAFFEIMVSFFAELGQPSVVDVNGNVNRGNGYHFSQAFSYSKRERSGWYRKNFYRLLVAVFAVAGGISLISFVQVQENFYPSTMVWSRDNNNLNITQAIVVHLNLKTTKDGAPPMVKPKYGASYAICNNQWYGLDIVDYTLLSTLAYYDVEDPVQEIASSMFPNVPDIVVLQPLNKNEKRRNHYNAQFLEVQIPSANLTVIAVRGTDVGRIIDFLEDAKLWIEPVVFNLLSFVFPSIRWWNEALINTIIGTFSEGLHFFGFQYDLSFYQPLVNHVDKIKELKDRNVIITGHSLGGGLAQIVGALTNTTAIAFSPPGIVKSRSKFSLQNHSRRVRKTEAFRHSVSIFPESDFVTGVDIMSGLVQAIVCEEEHTFSCHMIQGTLCSLLEACGDRRERFSQCNYEMRINSFFSLVIEYVDANMVFSGVAFLLVLYLAVMYPLTSDSYNTMLEGNANNNGRKISFEKSRKSSMIDKDKDKKV